MKIGRKESVVRGESGLTAKELLDVMISVRSKEEEDESFQTRAVDAVAQLMTRGGKVSDAVKAKARAFVVSKLAGE